MRTFAVGTGVVDVVRHRKRPAADQRHLPAKLDHAVRNLRELGPDAVGQHRFLRLQQLGRHVDVLDVELLDSHRLHALRGLRLLQILAAELAVVGRIGENCDLLEAALATASSTIIGAWMRSAAELRKT